MTESTLANTSFLVHGGAVTLVDQIVAWVVARIDERVYRIGARVPSIREFSQRHAVSRFTVVEAYDRLIARGYLESRRGSGFYVSKRTDLSRDGKTTSPWVAQQSADIDVVWLIRNLFRQLPHEAMPGAGTLPPEWLDADLVGNSLRAIGRANARAFLDYGAPQGYLPLRQQISIKLAEMDLLAAPEQILTTAGVTQGLDLIAQLLIKPGDTIFVDQPAWYLMFGRFDRLGAHVVGVPRVDDGPDLDALRRLALVHRPKLFVTTSILHNPTGSSTSASKAHRILQTASEFDFFVAEDDVYGDFHPGRGGKTPTRLAMLDQWHRVLYLSSFSKTLAANLRVGYLVAAPDLVRKLTDLKMLIGLTTSELGERLVYRVLSEGQYRKHTERLRERLQRAREPAIRALERIGMKLPVSQSGGAGMFLWADAGVDTLPVAQKMAEQDYLVAPGSLFLPDQGPSTWMRFNIATCNNPASLAALERSLARVSGLP